MRHIAAPVEVLQLPGLSARDKLRVMGCSIRLQGGVRGMDAKRWADPPANTRELRPYMELSAHEPPQPRPAAAWTRRLSSLASPGPKERPEHGTGAGCRPV